MSTSESLELSARERELQKDVCELEWPSDAGEQYTIMKLIADFMKETGSSQTWTATIVGWPRKTLADRLTRFRSSEAERLAKGAKHSPNSTDVEKAQRIAKANPEAFLDDPATARKVAAAMVDSPTSAKIVEAAFEATPLEPTNGKAKKVVEDQQPGELLLMEFHAWFIRGKKLLGLAQESGKLNKAGREDLEEIAGLVRALTDLIVTAGTSGTWDEELDALVEEGR